MPSSILNSDDGVVSGTSGLKSSGGDDGTLAVQSNGTELAKFKTTELVINDGGDNYDFRVEGDTNANLLVADASADAVGIGVSTPAAILNVDVGAPGGADKTLGIFQSETSRRIGFVWDDSASTLGIATLTNNAIAFHTNGNSSERMRIDSSGNLLVGKTAANSDTVGFEANATGFTAITRSAGNCLVIDRLVDDGILVSFRQANNQEGNISVSGSTVSYNGGHLSRWAQMLTNPDLLKGTVMSNLDEMNVYIAPTTYWTEEDELPEGVNVGDVKVETHEVQNEQLNKVKVSDVEGDANVAGVFVNWDYDEAHQVDEINMAMTGDMIIRIAQGTTVARGDLLMSAGDGTAKPQGDDIVRSKTIAKVTSTHITCTYDDGSYCVPCVLMAC
jgi:hypothetical protein